MKSKDMKIQTVDEGEYITVKMEGAVSIDVFKPFEKVLEEAVNEKKHVVLDMAGVTFLDSASLGVIILQHTKTSRNDRHLVILNFHPNIAHVFNIIGLEKKIKIFNHIDEVFKYLNLK